MAIDSKTYGVLIVENDKDLRSYYADALNPTGNYSVKIAANTQDVMDVVAPLQAGEVKFIIINSNLSGENFCSVLQRLKIQPATFLAEVILISDEVDGDTKFLLEELSIDIVFPQGIEVQKVIEYLENKRNEYVNNIKVNEHIYEFKNAITNKNIHKCEEILENESFKLLLISSEQYLSLYGEYLILIKEYQACYDFFSKIVKNIDSSGNRFVTVSILNVLAKTLCYLEKYDDALMIYGKMATKSPKNLNHKLNVSHVHLANGRWQEALNVLQVVLREDPQNEEALLQNAQANVGLGNVDEAKKFMDKIAGKTELHSLVSFYNNRGVAFARTQQYEKALELYKNALFFCDKESSKIIFNIGICLLKFNHYAEAMKIFTDLQKSDDFHVLYENKDVFKKILKDLRD